MSRRKIAVSWSGTRCATKKLRVKHKHFYQVGPGEGVINLRASAELFKGLKLNTEAKSSWKLTVDAVQVEIMPTLIPFS